MHQVEELQRGYWPIQQNQAPQIIQVGDRLYQVSELPSQPVQNPPQPYVAQQPNPYATPINPQALAPSYTDWNWRFVAFVGGCVFVAGVGTYAIVKAAIPPPVAAPAPAQPIIINQAPPAPPPPPPMPYREKYCEPGGFMGMGQVCTTRDGYR